MEKKKRILVSPLDWGLGHATRCIPIIRELLDQGAEVVLAADEHPLALLRQEFPGLEQIHFPGYGITYPRHGSMALSMLGQAPRILSAIRKEHQELDSLIDTLEIDGVISDNRYGLWSNRLPCVFITHQVTVKCPPILAWLELFTYRSTLRFMKKYSRCWIPDFENEPTLSGELSHQRPLPANARFIGPLSRFSQPRAATQKEHDIIAIVSGPEPQRSLFEEKLVAQLKDMPVKTLLLRGLPGSADERSIAGNVTLVPHLPAIDMEQAILASGMVISRPGYSTVMDLVTIGIPAIFVPTPGQTEQEYLARHFKEKGYYFSTSQHTLNLPASLEAAKAYKPPVARGAETGVLTDAVKSFLYDCGARN